MAFADSCLAGESVHFYNEVHERDKIPADDPVRRIYMARHIIEKYIVTAMEVNISYRTRQEILTTTSLAHSDLFNNALNELMQVMKMNLAIDYWPSMFFIMFKEEANMRSNGHELESMTGLGHTIIEEHEALVLVCCTYALGYLTLSDSQSAVYKRIGMPRCPQNDN